MLLKSLPSWSRAIRSFLRERGRPFWWDLFHLEPCKPQLPKHCSPQDGRRNQSKLFQPGLMSKDSCSVCTLWMTLRLRSWEWPMVMSCLPGKMTWVSRLVLNQRLLQRLPRSPLCPKPVRLTSSRKMIPGPRLRANCHRSPKPFRLGIRLTIWPKRLLLRFSHSCRSQEWRLMMKSMWTAEFLSLSPNFKTCRTKLRV